jgi:hypothetical protein
MNSQKKPVRILLQKHQTPERGNPAEDLVIYAILYYPNNQPMAAWITPSGGITL